jgi:hypothetical protein
LEQKKNKAILHGDGAMEIHGCKLVLVIPVYLTLHGHLHFPLALSTEKGNQQPERRETRDCAVCCTCYGLTWSQKDEEKILNGLRLKIKNSKQ